MRREIHGVRSVKHDNVVLIEQTDSVRIELAGSTALNAEEARYLARQLNRLARRIEFRASAGTEPS